MVTLHDAIISMVYACGKKEADLLDVIQASSVITGVTDPSRFYVLFTDGTYMTFDYGQGNN